MRVAIYDEDGGHCAYRLGRIQDFVNPLTGEVTAAKDVAEKLLADAKAECQDCRVVIEHLIDNGDGTSTWHETPQATAAPAGQTVEAQQTATQSQEVSA